MKFVVRVDGEEKVTHIVRENGVYEVEIDGRRFNVDCKYFGDSGLLSLLIDHKSYLIESAPTDASEGRYYARVMGRHYDLDVLGELLLAVRDAERLAEHHGPYTVAAPMPGLVLDVRVAVGQHVEAGDAVVVMEAMKMQNELVAEVGGVVREIRVAAGDTVESQASLLVIEKE
jgi:biotin carboxyl carrier protein